MDTAPGDDPMENPGSHATCPAMSYTNTCAASVRPSRASVIFNSTPSFFDRRSSTSGGALSPTVTSALPLA